MIYKKNISDQTFQYIMKKLNPNNKTIMEYNKLNQINIHQKLD